MDEPPVWEQYITPSAASQITQRFLMVDRCEQCHLFVECVYQFEAVFVCETCYLAYSLAEISDTDSDSESYDSESD